MCRFKFIKIVIFWDKKGPNWGRGGRQILHRKKPTIKLLFKTQMFQYVVLLYTWKHIDILLILSCLDCCTWTMVGLHQVIKSLCRFIDIWKPWNTTINTQYVIWLWKSSSYKKGLMFNMRISGLKFVILFI